MLKLLFILTTLLTDTAATEVSVQGTYGQSTMAVAGVRNGGFAVEANAIYDFQDSGHRVFGEAGYTWNESRDNRWVENCDYERLYPLLTCDTVGGNMHTETYHFRGGYRMLRKNVLWHIALEYSARQAYRTKDPRPKNKVADLQLDASVGFTAKEHAFSWVAQVGRYKQNNDIKFYSELGEAMVYHLITTDGEYARFNSFKSAYYHGYNAGLCFAVQPFERGFLAELAYNYTTVTKELSSSTAIPIATLRTHGVSARFGYTTPVWRVSVSGGWLQRGVWQAVYGDAASNNYELLMREQRYAEQHYSVGAAGSYTLALPVGKMTFAATADWQASAVRQQTSSQRFKELGDELLSPQMGINAAVRYAFPIHKTPKLNLSWFFRPQFDYTRYTKTTHQSWQVVLSTGICF